MSYRLFIYQGGIAEQFLEQNPEEKPPLIYSIVLFQGSKHTLNWTAPLTLQDYLEVPKDLKDKVAQLPYLKRRYSSGKSYRDGFERSFSDRYYRFPQ